MDVLFPDVAHMPDYDLHAIFFGLHTSFRNATESVCV
jgi:hypothetical protein